MTTSNTVAPDQQRRQGQLQQQQRQQRQPGGEERSTASRTAEARIPVYVNVYDMVDQNKVTNFSYSYLGLGVFHSGLEILGKEYNFGGHPYEFTGVFVTEPKRGPPGVCFKESVLVGYISYSKTEINDIIKKISEDYSGRSYSLLSRNCNHFTSDLCQRLTGKPAPAWINRLAKFANFVPCLVPKAWIDPPGSADISHPSGRPSSDSLPDDDRKPLTRT